MNKLKTVDSKVLSILKECPETRFDDMKLMLDVIAGKFFICYAPIESETFQSLPKDLAQKYERMFKYPETFVRTQNGITAVPFKPKSKEMER